MIETAVTVVTGGGSRCVQPEHHLVPIVKFTQAFREPHNGTFGQLFEFFQYFLSMVHCIKTLHPEHDLDLDLQGQYNAKWLVVRVD